jgi:hypothetical protein
LVTKKGVGLTVAIIGGFVAASFLIYLIPQSPQSDIITLGDAREQLEFVMDRNKVVIDEFQTVFRLWENGDIDKNTFDSSADVSKEQVSMMILELRGKQIPNEWNQSYVLFIQALDNYKAYIEKTKEYVDFKSTGQTDPEKERGYLDAMSKALDRAQSLTQESINAMP